MCKRKYYKGWHCNSNSFFQGKSTYIFQERRSTRWIYRYINSESECANTSKKRHLHPSYERIHVYTHVCKVWVKCQRLNWSYVCNLTQVNIVYTLILLNTVRNYEMSFTRVCLFSNAWCQCDVVPLNWKRISHKHVPKTTCVERLKLRIWPTHETNERAFVHLNVLRYTV